VVSEGINGAPVLVSVLATEAGNLDTVCWSSTQHGISGSGLATLSDLETDAGCAWDSRALRLPFLVSASVGS